MPNYKGPCPGCGKHMERYIRPGRKTLCQDCSIQGMTDHLRAMADGTSPQLAKSRAAGRKIGREIRSGKGKNHARWVAGMQAYLSSIEQPKD